jgi:ATP-dependent 26S proteasome regulatory subunit
MWCWSWVYGGCCSLLEKFTAIGIRAPKGVLLYGPPGTGKTLLARACAKNTEAIFLKLAGPQLVQMYIGDGAKLVRDAFDLAKEKIQKEGRRGAIIFIDELDAIGTKRYGGEQSGDREVCLNPVILTISVLTTCTSRFKELCLSFSTSWTGFPRMKKSK